MQFVITSLRSLQEDVQPHHLMTKKKSPDIVAVATQNSRSTIKLSRYCLTDSPSHAHRWFPESCILWPTSCIREEFAVRNVIKWNVIGCRQDPIKWQ
ncbi:hypothetical protein CEXT_512521 [Caerostris extrusa]|uniref:Uncharacterized protein n=1 Tax=Caerostris extrusa TaxID=172846 RepID=A0AAV4UTI2_CAEEX|nr:hypothetical protein CEXT_512521 [Caerostris extrusa]